MGTFTGEVAFIDERSGKSKKTGKPYTAYSLKLRLDDGNLSEKIDAGFTRPEVNKGDYVTVQTVQNGDYQNIESITPAARPERASGAGERGKQNTGNSGETGEAGADRQTQIVLQHSQEMAIKEVELLIANGALPLSKADNKAGVAKRYEEITKAVEKLTVQRYFDVVTGRLLDTVADAGEVDTAPDGQIPAAANSTATDTSEDD